MLDGAMRKLIDPPLNAAGRTLAGLGLSADLVTLIGLFTGLGAAIAIGFGEFGLGLALVVLSRLADGLDGAVARATRKTDFGGYFDIVADFLFYGAVPLGFAFADPPVNAVVAAILLLSFYFNGASFLGYAVLAERQGLETISRGEKTVFFTEGLLEGTETIVFFGALCLWPNLFPLLALLFAAATFYTGFSRLWRAYRQFGSDEGAKPGRARSSDRQQGRRHPRARH